MGDVAAEHGMYVIQCKIGKRPPIWKALAEAQEAAEKRSEGRGYMRRGIAVIHRDGGEKMVVMAPETFAWLSGAIFEDEPEGW